MKEQKTRDLILTAARALITQQGYDKTSIGQISELVGIRKASIYYYFKSKEEILLELVSSTYVPEEFTQQDPFPDDITAENYRAGFARMGESVIDSYAEDRDARKFYAEISLQTTRIPELKALTETLDRQLVLFLKKCLSFGKDRGFLPADCDPMTDAQLIYTFFVGIDSVILFDLDAEPKAVWKALVRRILGS